MSLEEMWRRLAQHQPYADERGYGPEWARMCEQRSEEAALAAARAADVAAGPGRRGPRRPGEIAAREASAAAWSAADAVKASRIIDEAVGWVERSEEQK